MVLELRPPHGADAHALLPLLAVAPTASYGAVLFQAAVAYWILQILIIRDQGRGWPARSTGI